MIFIAWMISSVSLIIWGVLITRPRWIAKLTSPKYFCTRCHIDITISEKFLIKLRANEELEARQI